ncbi:MAG: dimethylsulfoniopropionate demethylase [Chloroflexi bacterium]|nr:dimethylsulfoniopropionate demethylase [Chloroflexota bacterium]
MNPIEKPLIAFSNRLRKSVYFAATRRYGCKGYSTYNHMYLPLYYESPEADYWRLIQHVALWDVACERQVEITGSDAFHFIQRLTPRNLSKCAVGQCMYVLLTAEDGGIINDPVLLRLGENHFWLSLADADILLWVKGVAIGSGMDVTIREPDVSPLAIQGPKAEALAVDLFGDWVKQLDYFRFRETELNGIPLILARSGWSKQGGYELYLRNGRYGDELWETVMAAGKPYNIGPGTPSNIERIESGLLNFGSDITPETNPFEVGLEKFVDLRQEIDFIGKEALRRIKAEGIKQKLVGLEIAGNKLPGLEDRWPLQHNGERSGTVTSATYSPRLKKNIALAMVSIANTGFGTNLIVKTPVGTAVATVVPLPFIK